MASAQTDASGNVVRARIFPLHLSPIEAFMLADDRPDYPMTFVIQLALSGVIDRPVFETALFETLHRHPLLRAVVRLGKGGRLCWFDAPELRPVCDWDRDSAPLACPQGEFLDLRRELGLRYWVRQGAERATLTLQFHHACCDGIGAYRFIGDLLAAYGMRTCGDGDSPSLNDLDPLLLRERKQRVVELASPPRQPALAIRSFAEAWKIMGRRAAALVPPPAAAAVTPTSFPGFTTYFFSREQHQRIREAAGTQGVTLNDLLLRDLFVTMRQWNAAHRRWQSWRPLRIMMPTDLRSGEDYEMPAANMTGYTFLSRKVRADDSLQQLLGSLRAETGLIKHERRGVKFMDMVSAGSAVRGLLPLLLTPRMCLASAVFSNVADPSRRFTARLPRAHGRIVAGNLVLDDVTGVPPLRPKTRATFSIFQYDRRLTVCLRCDPRWFDERQTRELLELYARQLLRSAEGPPPSPPAG